MVSLDDTIAAISTPIGEAGIGIVRMTGPDAARILHRLFRPSSAGCCPDGRPSVQAFIPYHLHYGHIVDPSTRDLVDEVLAVIMPGPRTYTRQDVVEIDGHGGIVALRRIMGLCLRHGARPAEAGEFTARAFLTGRLDLAQAEAVLDVVQAKTDTSLQVAVDQLAGRLSAAVRSIRSALMEELAYLEASIDFAEDDIPERDPEAGLAHMCEQIGRLLADADRGIVYRQGVRAAIVGRPNVGKSSLLNRLLRTARAIVTDIPGTTRDTLEETLNLQGVPVVLVDTAGISAGPQDLIEHLGIERSRAALAQADLALMVVDASQPLAEADRAIATLLGQKPALVVLNKVDLVQTRGLYPAEMLNARSVLVSALTGEGIDALEDAIVETVLSGRVSASEAPMVTSPRHKEALQRALEQVQAARAAHRSGQPPELVAIDLGAAVQILGVITGQTASEDLLETIFAHFCVGK